MIGFARYNRAFCCDLYDKEYEKGHCCEKMVDYIHDPSIPIKYDFVIRRYYLRIPGCDRSISFCPACGKELPPVLHDEYYDILEKEYGFDDPDDYEKYPEEFKSDAWWKKRNL
jgi:hypothetical protein